MPLNLDAEDPEEYQREEQEKIDNAEPLTEEQQQEKEKLLQQVGRVWRWGSGRPSSQQGGRVWKWGSGRPSSQHEIESLVHCLVDSWAPCTDQTSIDTQSTCLDQASVWCKAILLFPLILFLLLLFFPTKALVS